MTVTAFKEYKTYLYDENGNPIFVQPDLRNDVMREFYEQMMEDFEDTISAIEALKENDGERIPWETVKAEMEVNWGEQ